MEKIKIAAIQMPTVADKMENVRTVKAYLEKIKVEKPDFVILPEMFCCPYQTENFPIYAEEEGGPIWQQLSAYAKQYGVYLIGGSMPEKDAEDLKRFHQLQDEYLLLVNNDIKSIVELVDFISEKEDRIQQIEDRQKEIYRESSSRKRSIKNEEQYREYQIWHMEVQEELDELKQEKREIKRKLQLADGIVKEDLYTAYYAVSENEEIVADRNIEIPGMEKEAVSEKDVAVEPEMNVEVVNPDNNQNEMGRQKEQADSARKQQTDLDGIGIPEPHNSPDVNVVRVGESMTDVTDKSELVETRETEPVDRADWIARRISELGGYENVSDSVKADIFGLDIADVSSSIRLFSDVMKRLGIKLNGMSFLESFRRFMMRVLVEMLIKKKIFVFIKKMPEISW